MSKEVDTKVIQLQFENGDFEKGVKESKKSIGELDDSIRRLSDSANGSESVEKVSRVVVDKMSVMSSVINATITRLTNNVLDSAHKITHAFDDLTIAPVSKGFSKYEEQIGSVQTIMNATGKSIQDVQKQLDKLMWYTDETSYSYSDMASNIGKFTSAGVELDDAVTAMMGIANWAGVSGANVQQASRAMYNLSQAMGTGSLKLQDWMSIENANMATKEFKQTLIDTAIEIGVLEKDTEITAENMRETLKDGWVTADVLTKTLAKYGNYTEDLYKIYKDSIGTENELGGATDAMEVYEEKYEGIMEDLYKVFKQYGKESEEFKKKVEDNSITLQTAMDLVSIQDAREYNKGLESIREVLKKLRDQYGYDSEQFRKEAEKNGFTVREAAKMVEEGVETFKMTEQSLGEKSLKASQEAKTFKDAWEATIDGVSSAWLRFWQALFGNYEEARDLWTWLANDVLYNAFTAPAAAIANAMEMAKEMGSFEEIFEGFQTLWSGPEDEQGNRNGGIVAIFNAIKEAFTTIVPFFENSKSFSFYVYALTVRFREWAESITLSDEKLLELKETAEDIFTMLKAVGEIGFNLGWNILRIIKAILPSRETILGLIKDIFGETAKVEEQVDGITNKVTFVTNVIVFAITVIKRVLLNALKTLPQIAAAVLGGIVNAVYNFANSDIFKITTTIVTTVGAAVIGVVAFVANQLSYLFTLIFGLVDAIIGVIEQFRNSEDKIEWLKEQFSGILKIFEPIGIIFDSVIKTFKVMSAVVGGFLSGITDFISKIDVWRAALILLVLTLVSNGVGILSFIGMVGQGIVGFVKNFIVTLNPIKMILHNFLSGIADAVDSLINIIDVAKIEAMGHLIFTYALAVMLLAGAALMLSTIDEKQFKAAVFGTIGIMAILYAFVWGLNKLTSTKTITTTHDAVNNLTGLKEDITTIATTFKMGLGLIGIGFAAKAMAALVKELGVVYDAVGGDPLAFFTVITGVAILFAGLFAGLAFLITTIKKSTETNIKSDIKSLDGFVLNIDLLGGTLNKLALALVGIGIALAIMDFVDPDRLVQSAIVLGIAAVALSLISGAIGLFTKKVLIEKDADETNKAVASAINGYAKVIGSIASGIFKISLSLALLSLVDSDKLEKATYALGTMTIALMGLIAAMTLLVRSVNQEYVSDLKGQIGKFNGNFGASGNAGVYKNGVGGNDLLKAALAIQMLSLSLSTLALSLIPLTFVDVSQLAIAAGVIAGLMATMSLILAGFSAGLDSAKQLESMDIVKIAGSIAIMAVGVNLITAALLPLAAGMAGSQYIFAQAGLEDTRPIERAADIIGGIIAAFVAYVWAIMGALALYQSKVDLFVNDDTFTAVAKSMILMAAGVDLIALAISGLMTVQMMTIAKNEHSLRDATGAIVAVMGSMSAMVAGMILSLAVVAKSGGYSDADKVVKQVGILLTLMGAAVTIVTGCIAALSLIGLLPKAKVTEVSSVIASIMVIMGAFGDLAIYMTSKLQWDQSSTIRALGTTFVLMGTGIAIVSAGIALIAYEIGKNHADSDAISAAVWGLVGIFAVVAGYLAIMAAKADTFTDLSNDLLKIAGATGIMSLAIGVIAVALGEILQYGEDSFAAIGIFTTLIAVIGVYNAVMMELVKAKGIDNSKTMELIAIATDFLIMSAAIAIIAPAIEQLASIQNGSGQILQSVIEGVILPMAAMVVAVFALVDLANGKSGNGASLDKVGAVSLLIVSMAAAMAILAHAATALASIDPGVIGEVSASIVTTMVAFTVCVGLLSYISDKTNDSIPKLAISFLIFAASIWLVSEALDSMHTAMANIVNDPNVQNFSTMLAEFITEHPVAAAATALGVGIGANIVLGMKDVLEDAGHDILKDSVRDLLKTLGTHAKDWLLAPITINAATGVITGGFLNKIGSKIASAMVASSGAGLSGYLTTSSIAGIVGSGATQTAIADAMANGGVVTSTTAIWSSVAVAAAAVFSSLFMGLAIGDIVNYIKDDEFKLPLQKAFYEFGQELATKTREGWDSLNWFEKDIAMYGESIRALEGYSNLKNNAIKFEDKSIQHMSDAMEKYRNSTGELMTYEQMVEKLGESWGKSWETSGVWVSDVDPKTAYKQVYDAYYNQYYYAKEQLEKKQAEESQKRIDAASKSIGSTLSDIYNEQGKLLTLEETIAEYKAKGYKDSIIYSQEFKSAYEQAAKIIDDEIRKEERAYQQRRQQELEAYNERIDQITHEDSYMDIIRTHNLKEDQAAIKARTDYEKAQSEAVHQKQVTNAVTIEEYTDRKLGKDQSILGLTEATSDELKDISDTTDSILTKDGARNQELSEQNKLLAEQSGILRYNNALQGGGLSSIISEVTNSHSIISTISGLINSWKDDKIQKLTDFFQGKGIKSINNTTLGNVFEIIKGGGTYTSLADRIKKALGITSDATAKDIFEQLGGGIIDFSAFSQFDLNDIQGSINKLFKGQNTAEGNKLFEEIFKMDASDFSIDAFLSKITGDLKYEDIIAKLGGEDIAGAYEQTDWSKVTDVFSDEFNNIGNLSADSFANSFGNTLTTSGIQSIKSPLEQMGETIVSIIQPAADKLNQILEERANAAAQAYTTAFQAAKEVWDKENPGEDTTLIGRSVDEMNSTVESAANSAVMIGVYKKNYEYWKDRAKKLGSTILNTDGTYKEGVTDKQKEPYEKAKAEADRYKQLLDSEKENNKAIKEEIRKDAERIMYINNPEKLEEAISDAEEKRDNIYRSMVDGTFEAGTDIVDELQKANDNLNELITLREEIGADLVANNPDDEANAIHEGFDFNSKYSKAAWNALTRENNDITKRLKEIDNELTYLYQFRGDKETNARIAELEQEATSLKTQREANRKFKNDMSTYEFDRMTLDNLNKKIDKYETMLKEGTYLLDEPGIKGSKNIYTELQSLKKERDKLQARIDQLDSLTESGIEQGQLDTKTDLGYNTLALSDNTAALNNLSTSLDNFGLSQEEIQAKVDAATNTIGTVPTTDAELEKYLTDNGYKSMSEIQEQAAKTQEDIQAQATAATAAAEQQQKEMLATAGVGAKGNARDILLTGNVETTSETTVSDIVVISNDVAAIRVASENILATLVGWRGEMGQHNAFMAQSMANIQNRGVPIANRMSFMNEVADAVDTNLGNKAVRRARGN